MESNEQVNERKGEKISLGKLWKDMARPPPIG